MNADKAPDATLYKNGIVEKIRTYANNVSSFESRIKTLREMIADIVEGSPSSTDVLTHSNALKLAQENLKRELTQKAEYVDAMSDLADEQDALKSARQTLSETLLLYFAQTGERQVEINGQAARQVLLTGRLGKESLYQPSLFQGEKND